MDVVLWVAVGICLFVIVAAAVAVMAAALVGVRGVKAMKAELVGGLEELNKSTAELEKRMDGVRGAQRGAAAVARLALRVAAQGVGARQLDARRP